MKKDFQPYKGLDFGFRNLKSVADFSTATRPIYDTETYDLDSDGKFKETQILRLRCNQSGIKITKTTSKKYYVLNYLTIPKVS